MSECNPLPYCLAHLAQIKPVAAWQPIKTAPRVTRVLVTTAGQEMVDIARQDHRGEGRWEWVTDDGESRESGYFEQGEPTHWMPLPEPPPSQPGKIWCMRCGFEGSKAEFDEHLAPTDDPGLHIGRAVS